VNNLSASSGVLDWILVLPALGRFLRIVKGCLGPESKTAATSDSTRRIEMTTTIVTMSLALALGGTGQCPDPARCPYGQQHHHHGSGHGSGGWVEPDGPGDGWGFPNNNPDGYGWHDSAPFLPLGANRTPEYFFPHYFSAPPEQMFMGTYYNPFVNRGQRYMPYTGNGGCHPMGGPPPDSAQTRVRPYSSLTNNRPVVTVPRLNGRVEAPVDNSGKTGLTP